MKKILIIALFLASCHDSGYKETGRKFEGMDIYIAHTYPDTLYYYEDPVGHFGFYDLNDYSKKYK